MLTVIVINSLILLLEKKNINNPIIAIIQLSTVGSTNRHITNKVEKNIAIMSMYWDKPSLQKTIKKLIKTNAVPKSF